MTEIKISVRTAAEKPNYRRTTAALLERCREFYQNPDNEKAFQEWKEQRDAKTVKAVSA